MSLQEPDVFAVCLQEDERDALHRHQAVFGHHD